MLKTRTMLAMLALGATVAFAGPAFAEKMKATLNGASEVPANTSAGKGTADIDYDAATKKMSWKLTYSGLTGPATAAHFHGPAEAGKNAGVAVAIPNADLKPRRRQRHPDGRPGRRSDGRQVLHQHPHRGQSGRRNPRSGDEVSCRAKYGIQKASNKRGERISRPPLFFVQLDLAVLDAKGLVATAALLADDGQCRLQRVEILDLGLGFGHGLAKLAMCSSKPALSSQIFGEAL